MKLSFLKIPIARPELYFWSYVRNFEVDFNTLFTIFSDDLYVAAPSRRRHDAEQQRGGYNRPCPPHSRRVRIVQQAVQSAVDLEQRARAAAGAMDLGRRRRLSEAKRRLRVDERRGARCCVRRRERERYVYAHGEKPHRVAAHRGYVR